jgi:DNA-binding CsgD family transcriptional regulator
MGEVENIDTRMQAALARLTDNEKECLRRRLGQQTAKEMALELGISPHAVEKRLKMARTKLGLSSSLEAARLLAATEQHQQTGPQAADLPSAPPASDKRLHRPLIFGGLVMTLVAAAIVAIAAQSSGSIAEVGTTPDNFRMLPASDFVDGTPEELRAFAEERFRTMDKDGSGFVERDEAPVPQIRLTEAEWKGDGPPPREWLEQQQTRPVPLDPVMAKAAYIAKGDANADGKLSFDEYMTIRNSGFDAKQVPVSWREQRQARR